MEREIKRLKVNTRAQTEKCVEAEVQRDRDTEYFKKLEKDIR